MSNNRDHVSSLTHIMLGMACFVVIVAGMRAAQEIIVPFFLSIFIAIICAPALSWLQSKKVPFGIAIIVVVFGIMGVGALLGMIASSSLNDFTGSVPLYKAGLEEKTMAFVNWLNGYGLHLPKKSFVEYLNPSSAMQMTASMLSGLGGMLTNAFLILLTVIFILLETSAFRLKLNAALSGRKFNLGSFDTIGYNNNR